MSHVTHLIYMRGYCAGYRSGEMLSHMNESCCYRLGETLSFMHESRQTPQTEEIILR